MQLDRAVTELAESHWAIKRRCPWRGTRLFLRNEVRMLGKILTDQGFVVDINIDSKWPRPEDRPAIILAQHKHRSAMTLFTLKHSCAALIITPYSK